MTSSFNSQNRHSSRSGQAFSHNGSPHANTCEIAVSVPWEVAEFISEHGPALITALQTSLNQRPGSNQKVVEVESRADIMRSRTAHMLRSGRLSARYLRQCVAAVWVLQGLSMVGIVEEAGHPAKAKALGELIRVAEEACADRYGPKFRDELRSLMAVLDAEDDQSNQNVVPFRRPV